MKVNLTGIISFIIIICGWYYLFLIKNDILLVPLFIFEPVLIVRFLFYFLLILFVGIIILIFFEIGNEIDDISREEIFKKKYEKELLTNELQRKLGFDFVDHTPSNYKITVFDKLFFFHGYPFLSSSNDVTNFNKGPNFYFLSLPSVTIFILICMIFIFGLLIGLPLYIFDLDLDRFFNDVRYRDFK